MSVEGGPDIVTDGLVLHLDAANNRSFVSGSVDWFDLGPNKFTGSLINGPTYTGSNYGSIVFDNVNDHVIIPSSSLVTGPQFSGCFWAYIPRGGPGSSIIYFANASGRIVDTTILPYGGSQSRIWYDAGRDLSNNVNRINPILEATDIYDRWNYYAFVKNATTGFMGIYINTVLVSSTSAATLSMIATTGNAYIGYSPQWSLYHYGRLPMVKIYSRELSQREIRQNYNATKGRYGLF